jgi:hypothetical protein
MRALEASFVEGLAVDVHSLHRVDTLGAGWAVIVRHFVSDRFFFIY